MYCSPRVPQRRLVRFPGIPVTDRQIQIIQTESLEPHRGPNIQEDRRVFSITSPKFRRNTCARRSTRSMIRSPPKRGWMRGDFSDSSTFGTGSSLPYREESGESSGAPSGAPPSRLSGKLFWDGKGPRITRKTRQTTLGAANKPATQPAKPGAPPTPAPN
jgi:hypothetical protein